MRRPRLFVPVLLSALLMTLAFPPADLGWIAWLGLAPLFYALPRARRPRHAFALGYLFGYAHWGATVIWIGTTVTAWTHSPIGWVAWVGLVAIKSGWFGLFGWGAWWLSRKTAGAPRAISFACTWTLVEWLRCQTGVAMPWSLIGYTQYRYLPLIQAADIAGVFVVTWALSAFGAGLAEVWRLRGGGGVSTAGDGTPTAEDGTPALRGPGTAAPAYGGARSVVPGYGGARGACPERSERVVPGADGAAPSSLRSMIPGLTAFVLLLAYGLAVMGRDYGGEPIRLALTQTNERSFRSEGMDGAASPVLQYEETLARIERLSARAAAARPDLVVWPESAVPASPLVDAQIRKAIARGARSTGAWYLLGSGHEDEARRSYNSAFLFDPNGDYADRYDKTWLVPFGEWVPLRPLIPFESVFHFPPDTTAGRSDAIVTAGKARMSVLICYETVFPIVSRTRVAKGANLLVSITNDSWAGESAELQQHIAMSALRAVETRRYLASSATTGITGLIAPTGRIQSISPYREDLLVAEGKLLSGVTPYVRWGDWFEALCAVCVVLVLARKQRGGEAQLDARRGE